MSERTRPRHPIRVVTRRTGLKPALIRAWETRYRAVEPHRGSGRHRLYSDNDIARLILLRRATDMGRRISNVASLSDAALARLVTEDATSHPPDPGRRVARCVELLNQLTPRELADALGQVARQRGPRRWQAEVLDPVLAAAGGGRAPVSATARLDGSPRQWIVTAEAASSPAVAMIDRGPDGGLHLPDLDSVRRAVHALNTERDAEHRLSTGRLETLLLIQEWIVHELEAGGDAGGLLRHGLSWLTGRFGRERLDTTFDAFGRRFTAGGSERRSQPQQLLNLVYLWLANRNPGFEAFRDLFDDRQLDAATGYSTLIASLDDFFGEELGDEGRLILRARRPLNGTARVEHQLETLGDWLATSAGTLGQRVLHGLGVLREEARTPFHPPTDSPPPAAPPPAADVPPDHWNMAVDRPWMRDTVLVAKNILVWLDQLSRRFQRPIRRLDDIPEEALAQLVERGFTALWPVGLWRRSTASRRLRQRFDQPDAVASAYSITEYDIAHELGGDAALKRFETRCSTVGLRLACDMVPNHTALDGRWVLDHPERFVQADASPFPGYSFTGENLSDDPTIRLRLEDGYADRSDAAVVFERLDRRTGQITYLYHGNDGTGLPWNDTAQLDVTRPDVRAALSEQILSVARRFPIVRFDAAMTLTRRHFQRLWYPVPGEGGAIPSRSEVGLTRAELDARMPREFWLDIVDRLAAESPGTLLIAEAFWLMEPYFVRQLGFHRVYHSAFLHAVRDERNAALQDWLRAALALEPAELGHYLHFLTTPDELSAAEAFGKGDKYFAACTLLATLPGTPLFGHGQAEGLIERYGMEYSNARFAESSDLTFLARHQRQIAPLLARRRLFSGTRNLRVFDLMDDTDRRLDAVYAFVNGDPRERALVLINNGPTAVRGRLRESTPTRTPNGVVEEPLAVGFGNGSPPGRWVGHDLCSGDPVSWLWSEAGLEVELPGYGTRVLLSTG